MNCVLNLTSDIMMLSIPLPLLITSQLPRAKLVYSSPSNKPISNHIHQETHPMLSLQSGNLRCTSPLKRF
jgi:hypothetical protein